LEALKISLKDGQTYRRELKGLGSAGYAWEYAIEGAEDVVSVSIEFLDTPPKPQPGGPSPPTYNRNELLIITALKRGEARVCVIQRRPWERDKSPLHAIALDISVTE
jgi:predicted secreted protein